MGQKDRKTKDSTTNQTTRVWLNNKKACQCRVTKIVFLYFGEKILNIRTRVKGFPVGYLYKGYHNWEQLKAFCFNGSLMVVEAEGFFIVKRESPKSLVGRYCLLAQATLLIHIHT